MSYYPPVAFSFTVSISGNRADVDHGFQTVSGLDADRSVMELAEGGENRFVHKLPGRTKAKNLVLKRGIVLVSSPLFDWCKSVFEADLAQTITTKDVTVSLLDPKQKPAITWSLSSAWPVRWEVGAFNAQANEVAVETIEMAYGRVERKVAQVPAGANAQGL